MARAISRRTSTGATTLSTADCGWAAAARPRRCCLDGPGLDPRSLHRVLHGRASVRLQPTGLVRHLDLGRAVPGLWAVRLGGAPAPAGARLSDRAPGGGKDR